MTKNSRVFLFIIIFLAVFSGKEFQAQSLDELIRQIDTENLQLKSLEQLYQSSLFKGDQVSELPDPEVSLGLFPLPVETRLGPQLLRIGATQMFPWKGVLDKKEEIEDVKSQLNFENIDAAKLNLIYTIKRSYFTLYEKDISIQILNRNLVIFQTLEDYTLSTVETGKGTTADVLRVQLKIAEIEKQLEILENQKHKFVSIINAVLNRPLDSSIVVRDSFSFAVMPYQLDSLSQIIMEEHPAIHSISIRQDISKKLIELNELNSMPSFGVGLDYIIVGKRDDADPVGNGTDIVMPRASVRIPLYRKKYGAKEQEEKLMIESLEDKKLDIRNMFVSDMDQAITDYREALLEYQLYGELISTTQATIDILESIYSTSGQRFDELLRLQSDLVNYDLKILRAIVKSHLARAEVERYFF